MVTTLWLRQSASLYAVHACKGSPIKWVKDSFGRGSNVFSWGGIWNIDIGQKISRTNLLKDYQRSPLIQLQLLVVREGIVTASEPDWNSIICCVLWATFWVVDTKSNSSTWNISRTVNIKTKHAATRTDLSREHVAFKVSCMVVKCAGAQLLQLWHYHNYMWKRSSAICGGEAWKWGNTFSILHVNTLTNWSWIHFYITTHQQQ